MNMNKTEVEQEAEMYMGDLEQQHKDIVLLAIETAKRIKPFVVDIEDLEYKLQKLHKLKEALKDNITLEITDTFLLMLEKEIQETKDDIKLKDYEIKQICEVG